MRQTLNMTAPRDYGFLLARSATVNTLGFTLIELMVAISIVAILSAIGLTLFINIQKSARDAKRIGDLVALQNAVRQYALANHAFPPDSCSNNSGDWNSAFKTAMAPYMANLSVDPINATGTRCSGGQCVYCFTANMWCGGSGGPSCSSGIANFWTYLENSSANNTGDAIRFQYGPPHFMKSIDPI